MLEQHVSTYKVIIRVS